IALAHDLPIYPVSSLAALADNGRPEGFKGKLLAAFDARMGEIYAGWFDFSEDFPKPIGSEVLCAPDQIAQSQIEPDAAVGNAFRVYAEQLANWRSSFSGSINVETYPSAAAVAALTTNTEAVNVDQIQPIYLRDQVAERPKRLG
ncbi:MAG: tRNA threonylcarbamoyladenosine biosynthesis protein TsaB, partial [Pseudomonadota bacterium]